MLENIITDIVNDLMKLQANCFNPCQDKEDIASDIEELIYEYNKRKNNG